MAKVKIGLKNLSITEKIAKADAIVLQMTGNASFTTPVPALLDVTNKSKLLGIENTKAEAIRQSSLEQTRLVEQIEGELDGLLNQLGSYVENTANGDAQKILSSGYELVDTPGSVVPLYATDDFKGTTGDEDGEVNLMWKKLRNVGKHTYNVYGRKYGTTDKFMLMAGTDKSKVDIKNLESGVKYDFYVQGVKDNTPGPRSETIVVKAG
jgi:hypothetical protein